VIQTRHRQLVTKTTYKSTNKRLYVFKIQPPAQFRDPIKMKTDNYLALCLEQAAQSPLHYRHGAIIVRGGKVIGQGFNDYRHGFDGGALKSGKIARGASDGSAIAALKHKIKNKSKPKPEVDNATTHGAITSSFVPFEGMNGGGHHAHVPLSMHSEMMAIQSALAQSGALASTTMSSLKPSFKLPGSSKHGTRLRNERLKAYVEAVCRAALEEQATKQRGGKSGVQEWRFEASASQPRQARQGVSCSFTQGRGGGGSGGKYGETPEEEERGVWEEGVSVPVSVSRSGSCLFWETTQTFTFTTCA
jgi:deoxycytidylate deaminase